MKTTALLTIGILACALSLAPVCKADEQKMRSQSATTLSTEGRQLSLSNLLSKQIKNQDGANLGKIAEIFIDTKSKQLAYIIVDTGSIMGMGGKSLAVPFGAMNIDQQDQLTISMDQNKFQQAPLKQEDLADRQWGIKVHEFFGVAPYWEESSHSASEMEKQMEKSMPIEPSSPSY